MYYRSGMNLDALPKEVLQEVLLLEEQRKRLETRDKAQEQFMPYVHHVYDGFIEGRHHKIIAEKLEKIARGELKTLDCKHAPSSFKV